MKLSNLLTSISRNSLFVCLLFLATTAFLVFSCEKETTEPIEEEPVNTTPPVFNWRVNNGNTISSDSTFAYQSVTSMFAYKNGYSNSLEINLSALSTGTYVLSPATGNQLTLTGGNSTVVATSGKLIIASAANNKLSGTISATFATGTFTSMSGEFTDVPRRN